MLTTCTEPGCTTFVFGVGPCLAHERRVIRRFVRGRPFVHVSVETPARLAAGPSKLRRPRVRAA